MTGIAINGSLGFAMILTVLLRMGNLDEVLDENPAFPFMAIFHRAVQSRSGAAVMASIVMVLTISANVGFSASTSRQRTTWMENFEQGMYTAPLFI